MNRLDLVSKLCTLIFCQLDRRIAWYYLFIKIISQAYLMCGTGHCAVTAVTQTSTVYWGGTEIQETNFWHMLEGSKTSTGYVSKLSENSYRFRASKAQSLTAGRRHTLRDLSLISIKMTGQAFVQGREMLARLEKAATYTWSREKGSRYLTNRTSENSINWQQNFWGWKRS